MVTLSMGLTPVTGLGGDDACTVIPASLPGVISVGASDMADTRLDASNYGPCVTLYAPGEEIMGE